VPKESNYFEEACRICRDDEPIVSRTSEVLYNQMLNLRISKGIIPSGNFNILYFFQSAIKALLREFPGVVLTTDVLSYQVEPINGWNWPDENQIQELEIQSNNSIFMHYHDVIAEDSSRDGEKFDVSYADRVIMCALRKTTESNLLGIWTEKPSKSTEEKADPMDFDYWLSGFNSD